MVEVYRTESNSKSRTNDKSKTPGSFWPHQKQVTATYFKAEIANEIQRGLDFLAADVRDVPERHRSMAAAFSQSWNLLSDDEQKIFRRMSVFRGGFTHEAAEKVTGATLTLSVAGTVTPGVYGFTILGVAGGTQRSAAATLTVS